MAFDAPRNAVVRDEAHHPLRSTGVHDNLISTVGIVVVEGLHRRANVSREPERAIIRTDNRSGAKIGELLGAEGASPTRVKFVNPCVASLTHFSQPQLQC